VEDIGIMKIKEDNFACNGETVLWDITTYSLVGIRWWFGGACCHFLSSRKQAKQVTSKEQVASEACLFCLLFKCEDWGSMFFTNISELLPDYVTLLSTYCCENITSNIQIMFWISSANEGFRLFIIVLHA
jgi:hypothetical protein